MSLTADPTPAAGATRGRAAAVSARKTAAFKVWAGIGAAFLALEAYVMIAWVLSDDFDPVPSGPSQMSGSESFMSVFWQAGGVVALLGFIYWFVIRPKRQNGRLSTDGLLVLCFSLIVWQDPWCNYIKDWGTYNTNLIQWGSWVEQIPGWMSPNGSRFAEPLLVMIPIYVWAVFGITILGCAAMRAVKRRFPGIGTFGLIAFSYALFIVVDFVLELIWMRTGIWSYPGGGPIHVFFEGSRYQFPIHESLLWGAAWAGFTCLRYFRNDRGETFAERGAQDAKISDGRKTGLRFLALFGAINVIYLGLYNLPTNAVVMHNEKWAPGVEKVSYMNAYLCGKGTTYACLSEKTPIPWGSSVHLSPEGKLVPNDAEPARPVGIKD